MTAVFGTPSFEEVNKSPSLGPDAEATIATLIEKIIKALRPKKPLKQH
jgi:hypothetical protein